MTSLQARKSVHIFILRYTVYIKVGSRQFRISGSAAIERLVLKLVRSPGRCYPRSFTFYVARYVRSQLFFSGSGLSRLWSELTRFRFCHVRESAVPAEKVQNVL